MDKAEDGDDGNSGVCWDDAIEACSTCGIGRTTDGVEDLLVVVVVVVVAADRTCDGVVGKATDVDPSNNNATMQLLGIIM